MRIDSGASSAFAWQPAVTDSNHQPEGGASFAAMLAATSPETGVEPGPTPPEPVNFTSMTRQEMWDWMNEQLRTGQMSFEESTPFLSMTVRFSADTGEPVDMATDTTRLDFVQQARLGIEGALWRHDADAAKRLQSALDRMQSQQPVHR